MDTMLKIPDGLDKSDSTEKRQHGLNELQLGN